MADVLTLRMDDEFAADLRAAAAVKGLPVEGLVREALARYLALTGEGGDDPNPAIDERILSEAANGGATTAWERLRPWVQSWGKPDEAPPPEWRR